MRGCQPFFFQVVCEPANCARAIGSDRHQQYGIDSVIFHDTGQASGGGLHLLGVGGSHKRIMVLGNASDRAVCNQFPEAIDKYLLSVNKLS